MKLTIPQLLGSVTGAVMAALIASFFGVQGTIIGVAIGSAVATTASFLVHASIERSRTAVRQAMPTQTSRGPYDQLRRLGDTQSTGESVQRTETAGQDMSRRRAGDRASTRVQVAQAPEPRWVAGTGAPGATSATPSAIRASTGGSMSTGSFGLVRRLRWKPLVISIAGVFVVALLVVTVVELAAGSPLSSIVGSNSGGTSPSIIGGGSPTTTTPSTTTTTTTSPTTTTSTRPPATTTTTTAPRPSSPTTTAPGSTQTTTGAGGGAATTTTTTAGH